jgi:5-methylcytosine-specific restriction protein A
MPHRRPCLRCKAISRFAYCDKCKVLVGRMREARRGTATQRGYDSEWRKLSLGVRQLHPFCARCGAVKDLTVDHIKSLKDGGARLDPSNLQVLCRSCNSSKAHK